MVCVPPGTGAAVGDSFCRIEESAMTSAGSSESSKLE